MFNYIRIKMKVVKQSASVFAKVEIIIRLLEENEIEKVEGMTMTGSDLETRK